MSRCSTILIALVLGVFCHAVFADQRGVLQVKTESGEEVALYTASHALLVGASGYRAGWPELPGVKEDVRSVRKLLEDRGFQVTVVEDPDSANLPKAFNDFINLHGSDENNRLLFYFAGHGHTLTLSYGGEMGFIVPVDAPSPVTDEAGFIAKSLDMQQIEVYARRIQAKHALFMFDSCFSGSIFSLSRAIPEHISYKTGKPVRQFITSGGAEETVPDQSIFRRQFLSALEGEADVNEDGYVTAAELGEFLQEKVVNYSSGTQHPQYGKIRDPFLDKGDFVFEIAAADVPEPVTETVVPPPPPPPSLVGHLQVNVSVAAKIYVNDELLGDASPGKPLNRTGLQVGSAVVRVEAEGYESDSQRIDIEWNQWTSVVVFLKRVRSMSTLVVRSNVYGDQVYVNDEAKGSTRLDLELEPGSYRVRVDKKGHTSWEQVVTLGAGETKTVYASLSLVEPPKPESAPQAEKVVPKPSPRPSRLKRFDFALIWGDRSTASDYAKLIQERKFTVALVQCTDLARLTRIRYRALIIGPKTTECWKKYGSLKYGDFLSRIDSRVSRMLHRSRILALGEGGYYLLGGFKSRIGSPKGWRGKETAALLTARELTKGLSKHRNVKLYTSTSHIGIHDQRPDFDGVNVKGLGREVKDRNHWIIAQDRHYFLWGFTEGPGRMTREGWTVFANLCAYVLDAPVAADFSDAESN